MLELLFTFGMSQERSSCCHILENPVVSVWRLRLWPASSAFIVSPEIEDINMVLKQKKNIYGESWWSSGTQNHLPQNACHKSVDVFFLNPVRTLRQKRHCTCTENCFQSKFTKNKKIKTFLSWTTFCDTDACSAAWRPKRRASFKIRFWLKLFYLVFRIHIHLNNITY
jgi:hypothetical protein